MIVYLADKIEPSRETYPELTKIRLLANADLKGAVALSLTSTADYVRGRGKSLHPATEKTLLWARGTQK
jgi:HD superfamily phosphohydrolase YqeK